MWATSRADRFPLLGRKQASKEMLQLLRDLRKECVIAFVGGSDLVKIAEQLAVDGQNGMFADVLDVLCEINGLIFFGSPLISGRRL
jgi:phosphomannomutase